MFEAMIRSSAFPVVWEFLHNLDTELEGVMARLTEDLTSEDSMKALIAKQELHQLDIYRPVLQGLMAKMQDTHTAVHGAAPTPVANFNRRG